MNTNTIFPPPAKWSPQNEQGTTKRLEVLKASLKKKQALPKPIQDLIEVGELIQWRRHPTIFFVEGVGKARIIWDSEKGIVAHRYLRDIPKDQYPKFRDVFNKLSADIAAQAAQGTKP